MSEENVTAQAAGAFMDLPGALVEEVLQRTNQLGGRLLQSFESVRSARERFRAALKDKNLLRKDTELGDSPVPTTCAVDGSYVVERMLARDLAAAAAVAVEGLTPPTEKRFWEQPRHQVVVEDEVHNEATNVVLRGLMVTLELSLAVKAPHEMVFLDGSMTTPAIYLNQSLNRIREAPGLKLSATLRQRAKAALAAYLRILSSKGDTCWAFCPKYTTNREIGKAMGWPESYDDRGLLSMVLEAGEFTAPVPLQKPTSEWHIHTGSLPDNERGEAEQLEERIVAELSKIAVIYYKPHAWMPALRVETNSTIAWCSQRLGLLLRGLKHQCGASAILEPFPLYLADRMVKSLSRAMPAFRQAIAHQIATIYSGMIEDIYHAMHGFRTDAGG